MAPIFIRLCTIGPVFGLIWLSGCSPASQLVQYNVRSIGSPQKSVASYSYLDENGKVVSKKNLLVPFFTEIHAKTGQPIMILAQGMFPDSKYEVEIKAGKDVDSLESVCRVRVAGNQDVAMCKMKLGAPPHFNGIG